MILIGMPRRQRNPITKTIELPEIIHQRQIQNLRAALQSGLIGGLS
jgi:hypothetical protein